MVMNNGYDSASQQRKGHYPGPISRMMGEDSKNKKKISLRVDQNQINSFQNQIISKQAGIDLAEQGIRLADLNLKSSQ